MSRAGHDPERVHFVSDLHFWHRRISELTGRPFASLEAMHEGLISAWNGQVALTDDVYVLGDFSFGTARRTLEILGELNGRKFLIRGNHDHFGADLFEWTRDLYTALVHDPEAPAADERGRQRIVLCHFPILIWDRRHRGAWHLHGHSHGTLPEDAGSLRADVGVDATARRGLGYRPLAYFEVKALMRRKASWPGSLPVDHHSTRTGD